MSKIDVNLDFHGNPQSKPSVTNSTEQSNTIPRTQSYLEWQVEPNEDNVGITGVTFYASKVDKTHKQSPIRPSYLDLPGGHVDGDKTTWRISFNSNSVGTTQTIWYDLHYADDNWPNLDWDPQLQVEPR